MASGHRPDPQFVLADLIAPRRLSSSGSVILIETGSDLLLGIVEVISLGRAAGRVLSDSRPEAVHAGILHGQGRCRESDPSLTPELGGPATIGTDRTSESPHRWLGPFRYRVRLGR